MILNKAFLTLAVQRTKEEYEFTTQKAKKGYEFTTEFLKSASQKAHNVESEELLNRSSIENRVRGAQEVLKGTALISLTNVTALVAAACLLAENIKRSFSFIEETPEENQNLKDRVKNRFKTIIDKEQSFPWGSKDDQVLAGMLAVGSVFGASKIKVGAEQLWDGQPRTYSHISISGNPDPN